MPDKEEVKSKRDLLVERLRQQNAERSYDTDDDLYGAIGDDYDQMGSRIKDFEESNNKFSQMIEDKPEYAALISAFVNGADVTDTMFDILSDSIDEADSIETLKTLAKERMSKHVDKMTEGKNFEATYAENIKTSSDIIDKFSEENSLDEVKTKNILDTIAQIGDDIVIGKVTPEMLQIIMKGLDYDDAVSEAEVRGKNTRINDKKRKDVNAGAAGPSLSGGASGVNPMEDLPRKRSFLDSIDKSAFKA